jgi:hypothetical protein
MNRERTQRHDAVMPTNICRAQRHDCGTATIELAFVILILFTVMAFITEFGRLYWTFNVLQKAVQDSARALSLAAPAQLGQLIPGIQAQMVRDVTDAGVSGFNASQIQMSCLDGNLNVFSVTPAYCQAGAISSADGTLGYVQVSVQYSLAGLGTWFPFFFPGAFGELTVVNGDTGPMTLNPSALFRYGAL